MKITARKVLGHSRTAGFMQPMVEQGTWLIIDGPMGGETVAADLVDMEDVAELQRIFEEDPSSKVSLEGYSLRDYCENSEIYDIDVVEGWVGYLSAPGYLDRTENMEPFDTEQEAWDELEAMYPEEFEEEEDF